MDTAPDPGLADCTLLDALKNRRSRRFALGMSMPGGPLAYQSRHPPVPLTEAEEATLVFSACGITGPALADLCYAPGHGGSIMSGLIGRTIASGDCLQTVALAVVNDTGTWFVRRPQNFSPDEIRELIRLNRAGEFLETYRRSRVQLFDHRVHPPMEPLFNINANRWSLHAPGTSYFLPINDLTFMYVNGLLEILNEDTGAYLLDERAGFRPAGLGRFAKSRGGHLDDDPSNGRVATIKHVEQLVTDFVNLEQGMMLQNLGLMTEALGLGGFSHFANHDLGWFQALGFRSVAMKASRYLGAGPLVTLGMNLTRKNSEVPFFLGLESKGEELMKALCPPNYASMEAVVRAVVAHKTGENGVFRRRDGVSAWQNNSAVVGSVRPVSERAIAATIAYCNYVWKRYARFPVHVPAFRCGLGFQSGHIDPGFYDAFYRPEALSERHRNNFDRAEGEPVSNGKPSP
jgi:hypothetical protein